MTLSRVLAFPTLPAGRAWLFVLLTLLSGCGSLPPRPPMTLEEIVQWSKEGKSGGEVVALLENRRLPTHLSGSQLGRLKEQGVPDDVLDYLMNRHTESIRYQSRLEAEPFWWYHPFHYRYPTVIVVEQPRK